MSETSELQKFQAETRKNFGKLFEDRESDFEFISEKFYKEHKALLVGIESSIKGLNDSFKTEMYLLRQSIEKQTKTVTEETKSVADTVTESVQSIEENLEGKTRIHTKETRTVHFSVKGWLRSLFRRSKNVKTVQATA
jgi:hypothetical protein